MTERKKPRAEATQAVILDGALRAFASKGYEAVTMADIAGEAGYSAPTLYNYFENKEAIILALHREVMDEYLALFDEPMPSGLGFAGKLELLTLRQTHFAHQRRDAFAVMMSDAPGHAGQKLHVTMQQEFGRMIARWGDWIRAAATSDDLHGHDPHDLAFVLWGLHHAVMIRAFLRSDTRGHAPDQQARLILDFFFHGLEGPPAPSADPPRPGPE